MLCHGLPHTLLHVSLTFEQSGLQALEIRVRRLRAFGIVQIVVGLPLHVRHAQRVQLLPGQPRNGVCHAAPYRHHALPHAPCPQLGKFFFRGVHHMVNAPFFARSRARLYVHEKVVLKAEHGIFRFRNGGFHRFQFLLGVLQRRGFQRQVVPDAVTGPRLLHGRNVLFQLVLLVVQLSQQLAGFLLGNGGLYRPCVLAQRLNLGQLSFVAPLPLLRGIAVPAFQYPRFLQGLDGLLVPFIGPVLFRPYFIVVDVLPRQLLAALHPGLQVLVLLVFLRRNHPAQGDLLIHQLHIALCLQIGFQVLGASQGILVHRLRRFPRQRHPTVAHHLFLVVNQSIDLRQTFRVALGFQRIPLRIQLFQPFSGIVHKGLVLLAQLRQFLVPGLLHGRNAVRVLRRHPQLPPRLPRYASALDLLQRFLRVLDLRSVCLP